jgi:hypothetical protein
MNTRWMSRRFFVLVSLLAASLWLHGAEPASTFKLTLQKRVEAAGEYKVVTQPETWPARQTAIIVCDMWDLHHCKNAVRRVKEMAPRMNDVLVTARDAGALIIHAPSSCMKPYEGTPARRRRSGTSSTGSWPARTPS